MWLALPDNAATPALAGGESATAREVVMGACGAELADEIDAIEIEHVRLSGDMLVGVLRLANDVDAQLIAIPNRGDPGTVRVFLPNLAEPVLLGARCSVLVVPDPLV
jgi:nucleotide-binding universal stress UspA family protein